MARRRTDQQRKRAVSRRKGASTKPTGAIPIDDGLALALRMFRATGKATQAAKTAHISPGRFTRFLKDQSVAVRKGRGWIVTDNLPREVNMISAGRQLVVKVRGFDAASTIALHKAAVRQFLTVTRNPETLRPFVGWSVMDTRGRKHPLETDPNTLLRLMSSGGDAFEAVYRIVVN